MVLQIAEFAVGAIIAMATLRDVFDTVVVPGESRGALKVARRLVFATLPLWRRPGGRGVSTAFAPFALVASFVTWMALLVLGFGLLVLATGDYFQPVVRSLPQALYLAGSGLVTVGLSGVEATGPARWVVMTEGFCGLAVMTLAITYLLMVQGSIAERDSGIVKLTTSAGEPPTGLALLERYAELGLQEQIPTVLSHGREWCAAVQQSHLSHPSLIYFRSKGTSSGWPAALGALMDVSLAVEFLLQAPQWRGEAVLTHEEGARMASSLIQVLGLRHAPRPPSLDELDTFTARLASAGYRVRNDPDQDGFIGERARLAGCVSELAAHLGTPTAALIGPRPG